MSDVGGINTTIIETDVDMRVMSDMELRLSTQYVAREGDHNAATFRVVRQPPSLDLLSCRAEIETPSGKNYYLLEDGEFALTQDIAVAGPGRIQLVYSDGVDIMRKTSIAHFTVMPSINAVDPGNPDFADGLAQLQLAAFAAVQGSDTAATFYNINGQAVAALIYPPGQGGGLDEAQANLLYVRQDGTSLMSGDLRMVSSQGIDAPIGVVVGGRLAELRWDNALVLRRGTANEPVVIENNNGSQRSEILTQLLGDARYVQLSGAQMTGPLITAMGTGLTNPGIGIGDNSTGFFRAGASLLLSVSGQLYAQYLGSPPSLMMVVPINMATQLITNVGTPVQPGDAANRAYVDTAIANTPRPVIPAARTYLANEVTIGAAPQVFFDQPFFTNDNSPRTILVTAQLQFDGGTPSAFYDLEYTTGLSVGLVERLAIYPTAGAYMGGMTVCFAATMTPVSSQIQVQLSVREVTNQPTALVQIGARTTQRTYVVIQEMVN